MEQKSVKATIRMLGPIAWLAFAAGLQMLGALMFFKAPIDPVVIVTAIFITFGIYLLNRFTDVEDGYNYPDQKLYFQKTTALKAFPILLIGASILLLAVTGRLVPWHMILIIGGVVYSVSIIPIIKKKSINFIRLKDIPFVKNIVVSLFWGITPFSIAASQKNAVIPEQYSLLFAITAFALSTFITAIAYDVPDAEGDRHAGVKTITTLFGEKFTLKFIIASGLLGCMIIGTYFLLGKVNLVTLSFFYFIIFWTGIVTLPVFIKKIKISTEFKKPFLDSQCVFCGLTLIVYSILF
jgi:4-hydroxybenzoate polyprenyltransferase